MPERGHQRARNLRLRLGRAQLARETRSTAVPTRKLFSEQCATLIARIEAQPGPDCVATPTGFEGDAESGEQPSTAATEIAEPSDVAPIFGSKS